MGPASRTDHFIPPPGTPGRGGRVGPKPGRAVSEKNVSPPENRTTIPRLSILMPVTVMTELSILYVSHCTD
jgi:hypothetical protein